MLPAAMETKERLLGFTFRQETLTLQRRHYIQACKNEAKAWSSPLQGCGLAAALHAGRDMLTRCHMEIGLRF